MNLSISNIAWKTSEDLRVYDMMKEYGFSGLEIAPTRIFPENPYLRIEDAKKWVENLKKMYGFAVSSMQSIWYGRQEKIFGSKTERKELVDYTKRAIDFAEAIGCRNLVFGCPRNRCIPDGVDKSIGVEFFREIGNYAVDHGTVIAMEANPPIYSTNYINTTESAFRLIEEVNSSGFRLNLDMGTMIENDEPVSVLNGKVNLINHVHISEPGLKPIIRRPIHRKLGCLLQQEAYQGYVSIEMGKADDVGIVEDIMKYVSEIF